MNLHGSRSSEPQTWRWSAGIRRAPGIRSTLLSKDQNYGPVKPNRIAYEKNLKDFGRAHENMSGQV